MYPATKITEVKEFLRRRPEASQGFVPTMGALHEGHLELIRRARKENDLVSCSIFVNPIQFNNPEDLAKYPRTMAEDRKMLEAEGCDLLFAPSVEEMYPEPAKDKYDFGILETVMEGKFRPGHFNGVAVVVRRLFEIMEPRNAYFGEKDYQQLAIIREMVRQQNIPVAVVPCPTVREADGLAMSSRNRRLSPEERAVAPLIHRVLSEAGKQAGNTPVGELKEWAIRRLSASGFMVEYLEIADGSTLQPITEWGQSPAPRAFVACYLGNVRLIDNMELIY